MENTDYLDIVKQGVVAWNKWRDEHPDVKKPNLRRTDLSHADLQKANLSGADLSDADLSLAYLHGADLSEAYLADTNLFHAYLSVAQLQKAKFRRTNLMEADLTGADLTGASILSARMLRTNLTKVDLSSTLFYPGQYLAEAILSGAKLSGMNLSGSDLGHTILSGADLTGANLSGADLSMADLTWANLSETNLSETNLSEANLSWADLSRADLSGANLAFSTLAKTNFSASKLTDCHIYGMAAWDLVLSEETEQRNLVISASNEDTFIIVDDIEVAQFIYLLVDNKKLRNMIETMTSKAVLILGSFAPERKATLDAIKARLRDRGYLPILFDFEGPKSRDIVETVTTVARLARFVIADLTQPKSVPDELRTIVPYVAVPVLPLIEGPEKPVATFDALRQSHPNRVLELRRYKSSHDLLAKFDEVILIPANARFAELENARKQEPEEIWVQSDGEE